MTDGEDVRTRVEDALRRAASTAYEAAHGALEEHEGVDDAPRWRFRVSPRVAVTATIVLALVGAIIVFVPDGMRVAPDRVGSALASPGLASPGLASPDLAAPGLDDEAVASSQAGTSSTSIGGLPAGSVVVHVAGAVAAPGLYTLNGGDRVADAVAAAGGAAEGADLDALNLARVVVDGEQVRVPMIGEATSVDGRININSADAAALDGLPGVGPVLAARIAEYRDAHGPFASVDALDDVSGVGPAVLEKIRAAATV